MAAITLEKANRIIEAVLRRAAEINCRPISVIVVEPGCKVKAFQKEDGSSMIRFEMAYGKAFAALAMGRSSKLVKIRDEELAAHGIHAAGLKTDEDCAGLGRTAGVRLTNS